jgi:D-3-phosphoglycerate dehydrogenase / 2-oxoglutarate reductase
LDVLTAVYFEMLEYTPQNLELLRKHFDVITLPTPEDLTTEVLDRVDVLFAPLGYSFDAALMSKCPRLKAIVTNTTGVPHIDVNHARSSDIRVISLEGETEFLSSVTPTAELTLGLMICATRNVLPAVQAVREGKWRRWDFGGAAMLSRMSLGVVGLGRLGGMVAKYAKAIGMQVSFYDPHLATAPDNGYLRVANLEELVECCDIITIHVPATPDNRHLFSERIFRRFKRGAYLVNTARGEVVDSEALIRALESGRVAGAALDVLDGEFTPDFQHRAMDHPLVRYAKTHHNLIITPHIGGSTRDAWHVTQRYVIEKAISQLAG